ncbi:TetR/AcrR family transcriptional regulator [Occallatibacter riparius]|uniref:TetR/AcrR family transcriptional regulator n=1 Tax=Occallatibacter riparius TaxID=1002689 RepID=A0A9J7BHC9_9BACT|nr:TetR/AcrR family transcriptional regulator [Occallatibacter riparius]UWZ82372.1 TetR/AcrR family transcriptional regulator [Occallatibacter riparius]
MQTHESNRRDRKRQSTLDLLSTVAMRLFERHGFDAVTMEKIAAEADVAKGTLYSHFPTKESALAYAIHQQLGRNLEPLMRRMEPEAGFPAAVEVLMDAMARWCKSNREYLGPYLRFRFMELQNPAPSSGTNLPNDIVDVYAHLIGNSQRAGNIRADFDARHLAVLFHHLCLGALLRWLVAEDLKLRRELDAAVAVFLQGAAQVSAPAKKRGRKG